MNDISSETVVPLKEGAKLLPRRRGGRPTHASTLFRWATRGLRNHKLETMLIGGVRCTSVEAIKRFLLSLNNIKGDDNKAAAALDDKIVDAGLRAHGLIGPENSSPDKLIEGEQPVGS